MAMIDIAVRTRRPMLEAPPHPLHADQAQAASAADPPRPDHGHHEHRPAPAWSGQELAGQLHVRPRNLLTQRSEWARLGFFTRTPAGTHALNTPP
jgi:hypothetical protein